MGSLSQQLLVVIPTYNEIENIEFIIRAVLALPDKPHLLIVDDSSPDGTGKRVSELQTEFPSCLHLLERKGKMGLGTAYIDGFRWGLSRGYGFLCEMDADFSHNPADVTRLFHACRVGGADVAIGSRYKKGFRVKNWPKRRILLSYSASLYVRLITWMPVADATAGFVCYRAEALEQILAQSIKMKGYGFQIEMKYIAHRLGYSLQEVPIYFTDRTRGVSKMSGGIFSEAFFGVLKLRFRKVSRVGQESQKSTTDGQIQQ